MSQDNGRTIAKPVTRTLESNRPRKTGSRYNDTLSCVGKDKGSVTMSQKNSCLIPLLTARFSAKTALGGIFNPALVGILPPPLQLAGIRVNGTAAWALTLASHNVIFVNNINMSYSVKRLYSMQLSSVKLIRLCVTRRVEGNNLVWLQKY